jgi:hypothetical protein
MAFTKCAPGMGTKPRFVRVTRDDDIECTSCGSDMPAAPLSRLGISTCLACSREVPKTCNVPMHKQAYGYTHDPAVLRENCYSTHK